MRFLFILLLFCSHNTDPQGMDYRPVYNEEMGAPCTLKNDIVEHTCDVEVRKPNWRKHAHRKSNAAP